MFKTAKLAFMAVVAVILLAPAVPAEAQNSRIRIDIEDNFFDDDHIVITEGDRVTWTNEGDNDHRVIADDGEFNSGRLEPGEDFTYRFNDPGTYDYYDSRYGGRNGRGMSGTIVVEEDDDDDDFGGGVPFCSPSTINVNVNDFVTFSAAGGDGDYFWLAPGGSPDSGSGQTFGTRFFSAGTRIVTLTSDGQNGQCIVQVLGGQVLGVGDVVTGPGDTALWAGLTGLFFATLASGVIFRKRSQ